jgi:hypothetical protein
VAQISGMKSHLHLFYLHKIKYLAINLTKEVKNLCNENCQTSFKEIKENTQKNGKTLYSYILEESVLLKCPNYSKQYVDSRQSL